MELIMANPTERELIRMRQVAEYDWNTMIHVARNEGKAERNAEIARGMKRRGYAASVITELCGLTQEEINAL